LNTDVKDRPNNPRQTGAINIALLLVCLCWLCATAQAANVSLTTAYQPDNFHRAARKLPEDMRRVLVLPLTGDSSYEQTESLESLYNVLIEELTKSKKFEVIRMTPAQLKAHTGKSTWRAEDALPETLMDSLGKAFACNGVLFCHLTTYRSYAPQSIGWRLKLVDARGGEILWAMDEVFDAGRPSVVTGVKSFDRREQKPANDDDNWLTLHSPRRFGRYSIATALRLLPDR
jgi:hypothetical protein